MTRRHPVAEGLFFATVATVTFAKLQWELAGALSLSDVLTALFLVVFAFGRLERLDGRFARASAMALLFFVLFALVYLAGFFNLDSSQALAQWAKGMVKFLLHFLFLVAGVALIARRGMRFYWLTLAAFVGGVAANAAYGVLQLAIAEGTGGNLDAAWLQPITGGASRINGLRQHRFDRLGPSAQHDLQLLVERGFIEALGTLADIEGKPQHGEVAGLDLQAPVDCRRFGCFLDHRLDAPAHLGREHVARQPHKCEEMA